MSVLEVAVDDHVATMTLKRPEARNALNPELIIALAETWDRLAADDDVRAIVVAAAEGSTFCSGSASRRRWPLVSQSSSRTGRTAGSSR